jgi:hypothetical protein
MHGLIKFGLMPGVLMPNDWAWIFERAMQACPIKHKYCFARWLGMPKAAEVFLSAKFGSVK